MSHTSLKTLPRPPSSVDNAGIIMYEGSRFHVASTVMALVISASEDLSQNRPPSNKRSLPQMHLRRHSVAPIPLRKQGLSIVCCISILYLWRSHKNPPTPTPTPPTLTLTPTPLLRSLLSHP